MVDPITGIILSIYASGAAHQRANENDFFRSRFRVCVMHEDSERRGGFMKVGSCTEMVAD